MWKSKLISSGSARSHHPFTTKTSNIADDRLRMAADRFQDFSKQLRALDARVRLHYTDMQRSLKSRAALVESLSAMTLESPLREIVVGSQVPVQQEQQQDEQQQRTTSISSSSSSSYRQVSSLHADQMSSQLQQYHRDIVSYVGEWEKTVSTRVATELKHILSLYKTWEKYRLKVESLQTAAQKKRQPSQALQDKISWNESKLRTAKKEYRRNLIAVTLLTEEVTDRGWKDLVPLLVRLMDFDTNIQNSTSMLQGLSTIREEAVELARRYEMDFEAVHTGRLRVLREEDAIDFCDPEDLQDLESTIVNNSNSKGAVTTPPCSDKDSHSTSEENKKSVVVRNTDVRPTTKSNTLGQGDVAVALQQEGPDDEDHESCVVPNYPSSIYLVCGEGDVPVDDETTLTGAPDLVSV